MAIVARGQWQVATCNFVSYKWKLENCCFYQLNFGFRATQTKRAIFRETTMMASKRGAVYHYGV